MTSGFLAEVGRKLTDRWLDLLILPGLLWVVTAVCASRLGQQHPLAISSLHGWLDAQATHASSHSPATVALGAVGLLAGSAAAGLVASMTGAALQRAWVLTGRQRPLSWLLTARQDRWDDATATLRKAVAVAANAEAEQADPAEAAARVRSAERRRTLLGTSRPVYPTRVADRFHAATTGVGKAYGLDLELAWPRLWTLLSDTLRGDLTAAQDAYAAAARLLGWGLLYVLLTVTWWPAAVLGLTVIATGWIRVRTTVPVLADLIETAADLHTGDLAAKLGIPAPLPLTPATGHAINRALAKT